MQSTSRLILIVEDDAKIADMTANYLHMHQYRTHIVADGKQAVDCARSMSPSLMLLDLMLPGMDGVAVCQAVRAFSGVPIIMVTARVDEIDRLLGLEVGADDYVCKPFSPRELVARVKALLRRSDGLLLPASDQPPALRVEADRQQVLWQAQPLPLTPVEYRLLALFLSRPCHVFARSHLLEHLHQDFRDVSDRAIDSHVKNIRRKLELAGAVEASITSVYGVGYRLETA